MDLDKIFKNWKLLNNSRIRKVNNLHTKSPPNYQILKKTSACEIHEHWDNQAKTYYQSRTFLRYVETFNPCNQRYYELYSNNQFLAGACVYSYKLDLFTFSKIWSPIKFNIVGIPVSISDPGIIGEYDNIIRLLNHIYIVERGLVLVLNINSGIPSNPGIRLNMLPTVSFHNYFRSWEQYVNNLRYPYRRRLNTSIEKFKQVDIVESDCSRFTKLHYQQYLQIINKTKTKIEELTFDFFRNLHSNFILSSFYIKSNLIGWNITNLDKETLCFFFGGIDYSINTKYNFYFNSLFHIIKRGINLNCSNINFGQTAEIPKLRTGGVLERKYMILYHKMPTARWFFKKIKPLLEYNIAFVNFNVFRKNDMNINFINKEIKIHNTTGMNIDSY